MTERMIYIYINSYTKNDGSHWRRFFWVFRSTATGGTSSRACASTLWLFDLWYLNYTWCDFKHFQRFSKHIKGTRMTSKQVTMMCMFFTLASLAPRLCIFFRHGTFADGFTLYLLMFIIFSYVLRLEFGFSKCRWASTAGAPHGEQTPLGVLFQWRWLGTTRHQATQSLAFNFLGTHIRITFITCIL